MFINDDETLDEFYSRLKFNFLFNPSSLSEENIKFLMDYPKIRRSVLKYCE